MGSAFLIMTEHSFNCLWSKSLFWLSRHGITKPKQSKAWACAF